jgi:subtilisin family serine protease
MKTKHSFVVGLILAISTFSGWCDARTLMQAVEAEDVFTALRELRAGTDPNLRNAAGAAPLEVAAKTGNFELCKFLLWYGAKPFDRNGKSLADLATAPADPAEPNVLNHLLRAYAFFQRTCRPQQPVRRPNLTVLYEPAVDYNHPEIRPYYYVNKGELNGQKGVDDDGNGFVDDIYGWASRTDKPFQINDAQRKAMNENFVIAEPWIKLYNAEQIRPQDKKADPAWLGLKDSYQNPLARIFGESEGQSDRDFLMKVVDLSHGTHVAGIVLKHSNNKALIHTVSWGTFGNDEAFPEEWSIQYSVGLDGLVAELENQLRPAFTKAGLRGSDYLRNLSPGVINASMGSKLSASTRVARNLVEDFAKHSTTEVSDEEKETRTRQLATELYFYRSIPRALAGAENLNTLFVVAAGNDDSNNDESLQSPSYLSRYLPNTITIAAAVDAAGKITSFSNYGTNSVNLGAPGYNILSHGFGVSDLYMDGTSMAAPAVAGCAALLRSQFPKITAAKLRRILENSGNWSQHWAQFVSSGAVMNPERALKLAAEDPATLAEVGFELADHHSRKSNPEAVCDALDYSLNAVTLSKTDPLLWWRRGCVLYFADFNEDGLKALDTGVSLNDRVAIIWRTRGFVLRDLDRNDEALKSFGRTIALVRDPATSAGNKLSWGLIPRARLLQKLGRLEEARKDVAEIVQKEGRDALPKDLTELQ